MPDYIISTEKEKLDVQMIHQFLSTEAYWSKGIPLETVKESIQNSLTFGVYHEKKQVGYARVISDYATIAYLGDVFILPKYRGLGLSKMLISEVMNHPKLQGLRRWVLLTADAHTLYKKFGWTEIGNPEKWMELHSKDLYLKEKSHS